jgi:hypothetical protein
MKAGGSKLVVPLRAWSTCTGGPDEALDPSWWGTGHSCSIWNLTRRPWAVDPST